MLKVLLFMKFSLQSISNKNPAEQNNRRRAKLTLRLTHL